MQLLERSVQSVAVILILTVASQAATITLMQGDSIQSAIDEAVPGDLIEVQSGVYPEGINITKPLRLTGIDTGGGNPVIDASDRGSAIIISAGSTVLKGFIARSESGWNGDAGIKSISDDNIITGNSASGNGNAGILIQNARNNTVTGNIASQNRNEGIYLTGCSRSTIRGNTASNNRYGIRLRESDNCTVEFNSVDGNRFSGIYLDRALESQVQDNSAIENHAGIYADNSKGNRIAGNNISGNQKGIHLSFQNTSGSTKSSGKGVYISYKPSDRQSSSGNRELSRNVIYQNNLSNTENAYDDSINQWDNGTIGNRFGDFTFPDQGCDSIDGICSERYRIPGGISVDRYPMATKVVPRLTGLLSRGEGGAELYMERPGTLPGSSIAVRYTAPGEAWIGLVLGDGTLAEEKVHGNASGSIVLQAPESAGHYRIVMRGSGGEEMASLPMEVAVPEISATPGQVVSCGSVLVSYSGAPGFETDWVGMYSAGAPDDSPLIRRYLDGSWNGTLQFYAPPSGGSYEFRMFENNSYTRLCTSNTVEVRATSGIHVTAKPDHAHVGDTITVSYWGAPASGAGVINMYHITTPDKFYMDSRSLGTAGCGQVTFVVSEPGAYDFRLFEDNVWRKILGQSNAVNVS